MSDPSLSSPFKILISINFEGQNIKSKSSKITKYEHSFSRLSLHNVKITEFFYHSYIMWNQRFLKSAILTIKGTFLKDKIYQINYQFRGFKTAKTAILDILESPKSVSRKIWGIEISWNFHTVHFDFSHFWGAKSRVLSISNE